MRCPVSAWLAERPAQHAGVDSCRNAAGLDPEHQGESQQVPALQWQPLTPASCTPDAAYAMKLSKIAASSPDATTAGSLNEKVDDRALLMDDGYPHGVSPVERRRLHQQQVRVTSMLDQ